MTVHRRFLLTPSFARLIRRERGGLRHVEGFFPEQEIALPGFVWKRRGVC